MDLDIDWMSAMFGALAGMLLGRWWAGSMFWHYVRTKRPTVTGAFRTGIHLGDGMYYIVNGQEYREMIERDYTKTEQS